MRNFNSIEGITMLFSPKQYGSKEEMDAAYVMGAYSDTQVNGIDVFGYVGDVAYAAFYVFDKLEDTTCAMAGDEIKCK